MTSRVSTANMDALSSFANSQQKPKINLRRGTWTAEEESYVAALIEEFKQGHLPLKEGMSLRCFLAKMVYCNPKRISKKFEGSNYNGKQLYEQSDKELDPDEAHIRRTKLQDLELKFENSIEALKTAEHSKRAGAGAGTVQSLAGATSLHHQRQLPPGAAAGLSGILNAETSLLRGSLTMPGSSINSLGLGMNSFPSLAGAFDPALFPGLNPLASVGTTMNAAAVLGMGGLSDYGRIPAAGDLNVDSLLGANASLMGTLPRSMHMAAGTGITFPTLPNIASGNDTILQRQLAQAQQQLQLNEQTARRRLMMNLLSQQPPPGDGTGLHGKRPGLKTDENGEDNKRRKMS